MLDEDFGGGVVGKHWGQGLGWLLGQLQQGKSEDGWDC